MPIRLQISHPDRMVIGVPRGAVARQDLETVTAEIAAVGAERYRKIIDLIGAPPGLTAEDLAAYSARINAARTWQSRSDTP